MRHELRLLRDLLAAETAKLNLLVQARAPTEEPPPSAGTWTESGSGGRLGMANEAERQGYLREMSQRQLSGKFKLGAAQTQALNPNHDPTLFEPIPREVIYR